MRRYFLFVGIFLLFLSNIQHFELEVSFGDSSSVVGLTVDGLESTTFPDSKSGYAIDSILCDKGARGVWDYKNWTLKIRNITESRTKCQVNFVSKYYENILNGTDPVLKDGMIPVMINSDGSVTKASLGWKWYEYQNQEWANAVILNDESEVYYDGDIIPEDAIESYFVWIPRYRYQIFNVGNYTGYVSSTTNLAKIINVEFENKDTVKSTGSTVGSWLTHPAFTAFETNGMWVGKFETGYKNALNKVEAEKNENNPGRVQIKPNVYSWRGIQVMNAYYTSYDYKREYNSHMMKNTEWGAVAYLQHSHYGSHDSVRINNYSDFKTGYAGVHEPTTGYTTTNISCSTTPSTCNEYGTSSDITKPWNTEIGVLASTTKNITGVYDMSGGTMEYVMGVMLSSDNKTPCSGRDALENSGFNGPYCNTPNLSKTDGEEFPVDRRYYDVYAYATDDEHYNRRILGDATGEMGPFVNKKYGSQYRQIGSWYEDESWFVSSGTPWFWRGSDYYHGMGAGLFHFHRGSGHSSSEYAFRVVLSL